MSDILGRFLYFIRFNLKGASIQDSSAFETTFYYTNIEIHQMLILTFIIILIIILTNYDKFYHFWYNINNNIIIVY